MTVRDYYRVEVPLDMASGSTEAGEHAIRIAEERTRVWVNVAEWTATLLYTTYSGYLFRVRRKRIKQPQALAPLAVDNVG